VADDMRPTTPSTRTKLTYEDLLLFPDDGKRHELIDGEHFVTPSPSSAHQLIVGNIYYALREHLKVRPTGVVMLAPFDIVLSEVDVVEPDLMFFTRERFADVVGEKYARGAPGLAVEVLSPGTRRTDETLKRRLYERNGVGEYWVVDPEIETVKVYRLKGDAYERERELALEHGDALTSPLFPGLALPLRDVFALP
jgi:Uma2 family endonuclease